MIGQIRGTILEKEPPQLLVDVNGIGYEIDAPMSTFYHLPEVGQEVLLYTHFIVREDAQQLYGFYARRDRALFRALLKVNGVGPRLGLTILSSMGPDDFVQCVVQQDAAALVRVPGIGKKTAERLVLEMRDKLTDWPQSTASGTQPANTTGLRNHQPSSDAVAALIALGYKPQEASRVVSKIDDGQLSSEEIIRRSLREKMV